MSYTTSNTNLTTSTYPHVSGSSDGILGLSAGMQTYYNRMLLEDKEPHLVHQQFCTHYPFPRNNGTTMNIRKFIKVTESTTPLTEGNPGSPVLLTETETTLGIQQFGQYTQTSDWIDMVHLDMALEQRVKLLGNAGWRAIDKLVGNVMATGTNVIYANGRANLAALTSGDVLTTKELRKAVRALKNNLAEPFADGMYVAIVTPDIIFDLQEDDDFVAVSQYQDKENIYRGEVGKLKGLYGVRLVETTMDRVVHSTNASSVPYANIVVLGKDAVADTDLEGAAPRVIVKPAGSAGTADPLEQISTVGWKLNGYGVGILNPENMVNIICNYSV